CAAGVSRSGAPGGGGGVRGAALVPPDAGAFPLGVAIRAPRDRPRAGGRGRLGKAIEELHPEIDAGRPPRERGGGEPPRARKVLEQLEGARLDRAEAILGRFVLDVDEEPLAPAPLFEVAHPRAPPRAPLVAREARRLAQRDRRPARARRQRGAVEERRHLRVVAAPVDAGLAGDEP